MSGRLEILSEIDRIQDVHCKPCVFLDENSKVISGVTHAMCQERECPHINTLLELGEQLSNVVASGRKERAARKEQKQARKEGNDLAKGPKWKQSGITIMEYNKLVSQGKSNREIAQKFNINMNDLQAFKMANNLVKKRTDWKGAQASVPEKLVLREKEIEPIVKLKPEVAAVVKARQNPQEVAHVPTNKKAEQESTENTKPDTAQTDTEKQLIDANLKNVQYKAEIVNATKTIEAKDEHIEELEAEIIKLQQKLATPAITHDDYGLLEKRIAELEKEIALHEANCALNVCEQKLEASAVQLAEIVAENQVQQVQVPTSETIEVTLPARAEQNPYVDLYNEQVIQREILAERVQELEDLVDQLMSDNGDLMQELQDTEELNYLNALQFVKTYSQNQVNKRAIRNLERKGETA